MADITRETTADDAVVVISTWWLWAAGAYLAVAAWVLFSTFQGARQDEVHRLDTLIGKGVVTYNGKVVPGRLGQLKAEAEANQACWAAHPKPPEVPEPWYPAECGVYLPSDHDADVDAAQWVEAHSDSAAAAGWSAIGGPALYLSLGFVGITLLAIGASTIARGRARSVGR